MTRPPSDGELDRLLAELPRESASAGFTGRVLASLDVLPRRGVGRWWPLAVAAAAALAVGIWLLPRTAPQPAPTETRALQEEHRQLMQELESLKTSLRQSQAAPVLYLGGSEHLDVVLDLAPVWRAEPAGDLRPAAHDGTLPEPTTAERRTGEPR